MLPGSEKQKQIGEVFVQSHREKKAKEEIDYIFKKQARGEGTSGRRRIIASCTQEIYVYQVGQTDSRLLLTKVPNLFLTKEYLHLKSFLEERYITMTSYKSRIVCNTFAMFFTIINNHPVKYNI